MMKVAVHSQAGVGDKTPSHLLVCFRPSDHTLSVHARLLLWA